MAETSVSVDVKDKKVDGFARLVKKAASENMGPEDTVLVWPHLVYIELISMLVALATLLFLSIVSPAPLEEMASADTTPNPTKAPWYFLGLQELLVYFDPWLAGVVLPSLIIVGLMAIPYIDTNPRGKGYYTYSERKFAIWGFSFGLALWYILIVIGLWTRGLDWSWYWPWDDWSLHKSSSAVTLIDLELLIQGALGLSDSPVVSVGGYGFTAANLITVFLFIGYYAVGFTVPFLFMRRFYQRLGFVRYNVTMFLFLSMLGVPLKIFLRLIADIKYVLITPWFKI